MAEDKIYFLATSQSEPGEVTLLRGSPRMVSLQMQAKFHPAVLPSQNSLLPATQKGNGMHGDSHELFLALDQKSHSLQPKPTSKEAGKTWYLVSNLSYAMHVLSVSPSYILKLFRTHIFDHCYLLSYLLECGYSKDPIEKNVQLCVCQHAK